jgi:hypothetical protein
MLEDVTLNQALAFLFSAAGIAILLSRVPRWDDVPADAKKVIVFVLNLLAPAALQAIQVYIPEGVGDQTLANIDRSFMQPLLRHPFGGRMAKAQGTSEVVRAPAQAKSRAGRSRAAGALVCRSAGRWGVMDDRLSDSRARNQKTFFSETYIVADITATSSYNRLRRKRKLPRSPSRSRDSHERENRFWNLDTISLKFPQFTHRTIDCVL